MYRFGGVGNGMGGGGGRGSSMFRQMGRSVARAGVSSTCQPPPSPSAAAGGGVGGGGAAATSPTSPSKSSAASSSSSYISNNNNSSGGLTLRSGCNDPLPPTNNNYYCNNPFGSDDHLDHDWVSIDGLPDDAVHHHYPLGGPVPSLDEVHTAVSALTQVFDTSSYPQFTRDKFTNNGEKDLASKFSNPTLQNIVSPVGSELDWVEPSPYMCEPRALHPYGSQRVYDAFHILQTEPSVQRMVISISSDPAVWDAVLNNKVVQELRDTYYDDENSIPPGSELTEDVDKQPNPAMTFIRWILDNTKAKVGEVIEMITNVVNDLFKPHGGMKAKEGSTDPFEEKLRTSFMLSIMVLLIVVVSRARGA